MGRRGIDWWNLKIVTLCIASLDSDFSVLDWIEWNWVALDWAGLLYHFPIWNRQCS